MILVPISKQQYTMRLHGLCWKRLAGHIVISLGHIKMKYIQRKCSFTKQLETVDQFETYKEAREMLQEYRLSDNQGEYYISQRACKDWTK